MNTQLAKQKVDGIFTRLKRHTWLLILLWTGCIAGSLVWNLHELNDTSLRMARNSAQLTFENEILYRRWVARQGGLYVPVSEQTPPNPYLKVPNRDVITTSGLSLTLVNPAYLARLVHELGSSTGDTRGHITSLRPLRPENSPDPWEAAALQAFEQGVPEVSSVELKAGGAYLRLMRPFVTEQSCLKCHADQGYQEGDIRGGISVSVPMAPLRAIENPMTWNVEMAHAGLWLLGLVGIGITRRSLTKQILAREQMAETLRERVVLVDPARAEIIAREMQRIVRERGGGGATDEPVVEWLRRVPLLAGVLVAGVGLLVFVGWMFGWDCFKRVLPGLASMKANTALCFLLAGVALALRDRRAVRLACAAIIAAVAGLTLAEYITGGDLGLDQLLFRDLADVHTAYPGRMVQVTALCFVLGSASLLLLEMRWRARIWVQQALALGVVLLGLVGVLGYAFDVQQLYRFAGYSSMAWHTAASFVLLGTGLIFARPDGFARVLSSPGPGAELVRRFLPPAILLPVGLGWLHETAERAGWFASAVGASLFALQMMFCLTAIVWWIASALNRADAARRETETQLRNQAALMDQTSEALFVREQGGDIRSWNRGAEALYGWPAAEVLGLKSHALLRTEGVPPEQRDAQLERIGHWEGELTHTTHDGRRLVVESRQTATRAPDGRLLILQSERDITARKRAEEEREMAADFLRVVNESRRTQDLTRATTAFFQERAGCEAVGVRLKEGDDYPYHETRGFPKAFVQLENSLCAKDADGCPVRDAGGNPVIDCMCGNVICGRFNPAKPFFSANGSFWTNSTTQLLASTTDADRQARTRNRCNGEGYESVALIPLRVGNQRLGLLQLNDRRPGRFSQDSIALWERLAAYLAVALARLRAEDELRATNHELIRFNQATVGRELHMIELKKEINDLRARTGQAPRYNVDFENEATPPSHGQ